MVVVADAGRELVDVVDEHDEVVAVVERRRMRAERLRHRAVFIVVTTSDGRLLVHRRSEAKDLWPGWWDVAVGGVVAAGEPYDVAARRELAEEVGIDHPTWPVTPIGSGAYEDDDVSLIGRCYAVTWDGPLHFADGEVAEARLVNRAEFEVLRREYRFLPDSLALVGGHIERFLDGVAPAPSEARAIPPHFRT
jgi:isopentenyldiphosphate isomerase